MELRPYQDEIAKKATKILKECGFVYLSMEVRTGKTITALETAYNFGAKKVLFITKKKAFSSIMSDYKEMWYEFDIYIINKESLHTIEDNDFDVIIIDEAHGLAAFPKASKYQKDIRKRFSKVPMIFLSGTPTPESFSQWYHQLQVTDKSPFKHYTNFYKWANDYVNVTEQNLGYARVKVYKDGKEQLILKSVQPYIITFTQAQAGFTSEVNEHILECRMEDITYDIIKRLKRDKIVQGKSGLILGDTGVKLLQKVHQLSSGTCKFEDGTSMVIDYSKAKFIIQFKLKIAGLKEGLLSIVHMKRKWSYLGHTLFIWFSYVFMFYIGIYVIPETNTLSLGAVLTSFVVGSIAIAFTNSGFGSYPFLIAKILLFYNISETAGNAFGWIVWTSQMLLLVFLGAISFLLLPVLNRRK